MSPLPSESSELSHAARPARYPQPVGVMRLLRPDASFERAETGVASTADSNATNNTEGVLPLPRHETVWGSIAGPYGSKPRRGRVRVVVRVLG